jgi:hypothetical protein
MSPSSSISIYISISLLSLILDPSWANPIKDLVKARAKEQQARAVAQVVEATARSRMLGKGNFPYVLAILFQLRSFNFHFSLLTPIQLLPIHTQSPRTRAIALSISLFISPSLSISLALSPALSPALSLSLPLPLALSLAIAPPQASIVRANAPRHPGLHVVNGLPSSIYSTTNTSLNLLSATGNPYRGSTPGLGSAETPTLMAKMGYFDHLPSSLSIKTGAGSPSPVL